MNGLLIALGVFFFGGLGSVARFWIHRIALNDRASGFPFGTFLVNMLGAFLIGVLFGAGISGDALKVAAAGFLGGFTTFSTWMYESEKLAVDGHGQMAARNVAVSSAAGFLAVTAGVAAGLQL